MDIDDVFIENGSHYLFRLYPSGKDYCPGTGEQNAMQSTREHRFTSGDREIEKDFSMKYQSYPG